MLKVIDIITGETATIEARSDLPDAIRPWFPEAPEEVQRAIEESAQATDEFLMNYMCIKLEVI